MSSLFRNTLFTTLIFLCSFSFAQTQDQDTATQQSMSADERASQHNAASSSRSSEEEQEANARQSADEAEATAAYQEHAAKSPSGGGDEGDICGVILCMSGSNSVAPHECKPYVETYFKVRVYKRHRFRPIPTAIKRYDQVLNRCPDAEPRDRDRINAMFGTLEYSPFVFD